MAQKICEEIDQQILKRQLEQKHWQGRISKQQLVGLSRLQRTKK